METIYCSFCKRSNEAVTMMISGHAAHICDQCIEQAISIINKESKKNKNKQKDNDLAHFTPKEIKEQLDQYVIGQDAARLDIARGRC